MPASDLLLLGSGGGTGTPSADLLLLETGGTDNLLLEDGDDLLLSP